MPELFSAQRPNVIDGVDPIYGKMSMAIYSPISQIPQCIKYPTVHNFATEMCTFLLQNGALWDMGLVHCGICEMDLLSENVWT